MSAARGRGSTHPGRPAPHPSAAYAAPALVTPEVHGPVVPFLGEDGRAQIFDAAGWPLPGWHEELTAAFAVRVGPGGGLRTLKSAKGCWVKTRRLISFLSALPDAPPGPGSLRVEHLMAFRAHRATTNAPTAWAEVKNFGHLAQLKPLRDMASPDVLRYLTQRVEGQVPHRSRPGYSDGELRRVLRAARQDVAALSDRIGAGEFLLQRWRTAADDLSSEEGVLGESLALMADGGDVVPMSFPGLGTPRSLGERSALARNLFLGRGDLTPFMVLLVAMSGRNIETIKELPALHTVLEGRAVQLQLVKRRRGAQHWQQSVTWEIGPPGAELTTAGGLYLLLHRLTARSRARSGSTSIWSMWQHGPANTATTGRHRDPFAADLDYDTGAAIWAARHDLIQDGGDGAGERLRVQFGRIRTSVEVRRTKQLGGHLPSAARSNTMGVLFRNYLRGDPTALDWAQDVMSDAVADAERSALAAHRRSLDATGGPVLIATASSPMDGLRGRGVDDSMATLLATGRQDTGWTACMAPESHPVTRKPCQASFLDCFHCANCVVTANHLPRLVALLAALTERRKQLGEREWWSRYGPAWAAIRTDILTKFTPAQIARAKATATTDVLLDLVENPWETP